MNKKLFALLSTVAVLMALFVACGAPATPPPPVVQTVVVKETVVSQVVETVVNTVKETVIFVAPTSTPVATNTPAPGKVQVYWYIGLGAGSQASQIPAEKEWVDKYNASQDEIQLIPVIVDNNYARANLAAQLAAGNAPDIVGPVGTAGREAFPGQFLNIDPLIKQFNYDTSDIDPAFLDFYKSEGELVGLPFAIFPASTYVNKDLFEEAGLELPPQKYGEKYMLDGKEVDWDFNTVAEIGRRLTVDADGNDANSPDFDRDNIVQYGFIFQWDVDPRAFATYFCPYYPEKDGKADIPDCVREGIKWYYDGIWGDKPFMPNQAAISSDLLGKDNAFSSGKAAMALSHLWYTCCIDPKSVTNWDVAAVPSYEGKATSKLHGDTFAIMKDSKNPEAAFKVYTYMLGEGSADLYKIYGGLPARESQQQAFFTSLDEKFAPNKVNWQTFIDGIPHMDIPNHELALPSNLQAVDAFSKFGSDLRSNPDLDIDERIDQFIADLNLIYSGNAPTATPAP